MTWESLMPFGSPLDRPGSPFESGAADELLGRSCMKWGSDGELSAVDLQGILERLSAVDHQASSLMDCTLED